MAESFKVLVAHPAQQHSYRLAIALFRRGLLERYETTVYSKPGSATKALSEILSGKLKMKAIGRRCEELPDAVVGQHCEGEGLFKLLCMHVRPLNGLYRCVKYHVAKRFGKKVATDAVRLGVDAVIAYDDTTPFCFEALKRKKPEVVRILDMSAANMLFMKGVYEKDFRLKPEFTDKLRGERLTVFDPCLAEQTRREIEAADFFLCGSEFVQRTLAYSGVNRSRTRICHYGVDTEAFPYIKREAKPVSEPLEFVFVGGTKELKGISYLLDSFMRIDGEVANLTIVGANTLPGGILERYSSRVSFTGSLLHSEVSEVLARMDVMVFPSLGEGFSLSVMEGLASGLPVICSVNSGANDVIRDGENGFVIPIQDEDSIVESVMWFHNHREAIPEMSEIARRTALEHTWEEYYEDVSSAVLGCISEKKGSAN